MRKYVQVLPCLTEQQKFIRLLACWKLLHLRMRCHQTQPRQGPRTSTHTHTPQIQIYTYRAAARVKDRIVGWPPGPPTWYEQMNPSVQRAFSRKYRHRRASSGIVVGLRSCASTKARLLGRTCQCMRPSQLLPHREPAYVRNIVGERRSCQPFSQLLPGGRRCGSTFQRCGNARSS